MKLIDKSVLLAEIERLVNNYDKALDYEAALEDVRYFLDTLEVKDVGVDFGDPEGDKGSKCIIDTKNLEVRDVDLEKEVESLIKSSIWRFAEKEDFLHIAKHFFELGLKAQKGE